MKNIYLLFVLCFSHLAMASIHPREFSSAMNHLKEVNQQWDYFDITLSQAEFNFETDVDRIQFHLTKVIQVLSVAMTDNLTPAQVVNRNHLLDVLAQYAQEKVFPKNIYHNQRQPYFIDHRGVHCAVGFLLLQSGHGQLAREISERDNYVYVKNIDVEGLAEWANWSGFSIQELALIQPGYLIDNYFEPFPVGSNGVGLPNGPIISAVAHFDHDNYLLIGNFDQLGDELCNRVAFYNRNSGFTCFTNEIVGEIRQAIILPYSNSFYLVGRFQYEGSIYPIFRYYQGTISYLGLADYPNSEGTAVTIHNQRAYFGIKTASSLHLLYSFNMWTSDNERVVAEIDGPIYALAYDDTGFRLHIGGTFSTITSDGQIYSSKNYVVYNNDFTFPSEPFTAPSWTTSQYDLADTVRVILPAANLMNSHSAIYIGGYAIQDGTPKTPLGRVVDGVFESIIAFDSDNWFASRRPFEEVRAIYAHEEKQKIYFGGDLTHNLLSSGAMLIDYYGRNLNSYALSDGALKAEGIFDQPVNAIFKLTNDDIDVLGEFTGTWNNPNNGMSYLASKTTDLGIEAVNNKDNYSIFPNPTNELVKLTGKLENIQMIEIVNLSGQVVAMQDRNFEVINVQQLKDGLYTLRIRTEKGTQARKFIVQK